MKKYVLMVLACVLICLVWANGNHDALAREFFRLYTPESELLELLDDSMDVIMPPIIMGLETELGYKLDESGHEVWLGVFREFFQNNLSYRELEEISIPLIRSQFSQRELRELVQFLTTPTGRKYLDLVVLSRSSFFVVAWEQYFERALASGSFEEDLVNCIAEHLTLDNIDLGAFEQAIAQIGDIYSAGQEDTGQGIDRGVEFIPYDDPPVPIGTISPEYPESAMRARIQGTVVLEVEVYSDGQVGDISVRRSVQSGPGGVDEAAVAAVRRIRFRPGRTGGRPVDTMVIVPIEFSLN